MIEEKLIDYLANAGLSVGANIFAEVPFEPPDEYIVIEKTGSGRTDRIDRAMVAIQSIVKRRSDNSVLRAMQINEEIKTAMDSFAEEDDIFSCSLNSDYNFTNSKTQEYRYQAVFNIYF